VSQALQSTSKASQTTARYFQWVLDKTTRTFILVVERLILPHQLITLRLHILYFVVILGEGAIQFRLKHGGVLSGLHDLFLQGLQPEHCVAIPLEHARFLSGSLRDILQQTTAVSWVLSTVWQID
jgi:hypothetical protein